MAIGEFRSLLIKKNQRIYSYTPGLTPTPVFNKKPGLFNKNRALIGPFINLSKVSANKSTVLLKNLDFDENTVVGVKTNV